jgi:hypothetical protein
LQLLFLLEVPVGVEVPRRDMPLLGVELIYKNNKNGIASLHPEK